MCEMMEQKAPIPLRLGLTFPCHSSHNPLYASALCFFFCYQLHFISYLFLSPPTILTSLYTHTPTHTHVFDNAGQCVTARRHGNKRNVSAFIKKIHRVSLSPVLFVIHMTEAENVFKISVFFCFYVHFTVNIVSRFHLIDCAVDKLKWLLVVFTMSLHVASPLPPVPLVHFVSSA